MAHVEKLGVGFMCRYTPDVGDVVVGRVDEVCLFLLANDTNGSINLTNTPFR